MKLYIKNMVCMRCKMAVKSEFEKFGFHTIAVQLGEIEIEEDTIDTAIIELDKGLENLGFKIINDKETIMVEKIKTSIIDVVFNKNNSINSNLSDYLAQSLSTEYTTLSAIFSKNNKLTIEQYFIEKKTERVKNLIREGELNISEIANLLNYSSVGYLSNQFKKITGLSPSRFKQLS